MKSIGLFSRTWNCGWWRWIGCASSVKLKSSHCSIVPSDGVSVTGSIPHQGPERSVGRHAVAVKRARIRHPEQRLDLPNSSTPSKSPRFRTLVARSAMPSAFASCAIKRNSGVEHCSVRHGGVERHEGRIDRELHDVADAGIRGSGSHAPREGAIRASQAFKRLKFGSDIQQLHVGIDLRSTELNTRSTWSPGASTKNSPSSWTPSPSMIVCASCRRPPSTPTRCTVTSGSLSL